jgi:hypothetical protein
MPSYISLLRRWTTVLLTAFIVQIQGHMPITPLESIKGLNRVTGNKHWLKLPISITRLSTLLFSAD